VTARPAVGAENVDIFDADEPVSDPTRVVSMSREVVGAVERVRDMLKARAEVLEHCKAALIEQRAELVRRCDCLEQERLAFGAESDAREKKLSERERCDEELRERAQQLTSFIEAETRSIDEHHQEVARRESLLADKEAAVEQRLKQAEKREEELISLRQRWENEMGVRPDSTAGPVLLQ